MNKQTTIVDIPSRGRATPTRTRWMTQLATIDTPRRLCSTDTQGDVTPAARSGSASATSACQHEGARPAPQPEVEWATFLMSLKRLGEARTGAASTTGTERSRICETLGLKR
jgi:hypothetical protein